jgi:hypothetical protein
MTIIIVNGNDDERHQEVVMPAPSRKRRAGKNPPLGAPDRIAAAPPVFVHSNIQPFQGHTL